MNDQKQMEKGDLDHELDISGDQVLVKVDHEAQIAIDVPAITRNGIKLHPQPTSDALDPLNWSKLQKHAILAIVMFKYFLFTYLTTTTVPSFTEIQTQYQISYAQVNWTVAIPALGLSVGPLIWSSLSDIYGRRIVFIVGTIISLVSTIGVAVADTYSGYMAARFFQGFGVSPASTVGMAVVNDLFFDYERGQKLGLWVLAIDSGLLLGPTFGGFLNLVSAQWINWFNAILFAVLLVLELFFMPETLYPRQQMLLNESVVKLNEQNASNNEKINADQETTTPQAKVPAEVSFSDPLRTRKLPFFNFRPVPGMRHPKPWDSIVRFALTFQMPTVVIAVIGYSFVWYWWVLSVITMVPSAYATYSPLIQGLLFLGLFLGTIVSEICCSGRLSDYIVAKLSKKNGNNPVPEMRLWLAYPAILLTAVGLIVWGVSLDRDYHWIVGQIAFFLFAAGIQIGNTVASSYIVDAYPLQSTSVITFYAVFLNLSAFINPFFIANWEASMGWTWTYTTQALIVIVGGALVMGTLHRYGAWMREKAPLPSWVNPEYDIDIDIHFPTTESPPQSEVHRLIASGAGLADTFRALHPSLIKLTPAIENEWIEKYRTFYAIHGQLLVKAFPGAKDLLIELNARKIAIAIVSNKGVAAVKPALKLNGLGGHVPEVLIVVNKTPGAKRKPDPTSFMDVVIPILREKYGTDVNPMGGLAVGDTGSSVPLSDILGGSGRVRVPRPDIAYFLMDHCGA
ncbi:Major facilitator superfamily domain general substrate transporter [Penicillium sp. IBT 16267x]|nr:Major facilitator superfamily domain general substrate transporter [Penicillium sp. IBT 16267x]